MISRSRTEAEYHALAQAGAEVSLHKSLLQEMKINTTSVPMIWCDSVGAAALAATPVYHLRTKHIEINVHFIRDMVLRKEVEIRYVLTYDQTTTKGLSVGRFLFMKDKLKL